MNITQSCSNVSFLTNYLLVGSAGAGKITAKNKKQSVFVCDQKLKEYHLACYMVKKLKLFKVVFWHFRRG